MAVAADSRCVQRLRKRVALENYHRIASASTTATAPVPGGAVPGGGVCLTQGIPSFYTTPSLVTLSGLSVSDPIPLTSEEMTKEGIQPPPLHLYAPPSSSSHARGQSLPPPSSSDPSPPPSRL
jgi:hypothetical protein